MILIFVYEINAIFQISFKSFANLGGRSNDPLLALLFKTETLLEIGGSEIE